MTGVYAERKKEIQLWDRRHNVTTLKCSTNTRKVICLLRYEDIKAFGRREVGKWHRKINLTRVGKKGRKVVELVRGIIKVRRIFMNK